MYKISNYRKIKHSKSSQCLFTLLIASVFIFCVFVQKNTLTIRIEPVKAEEVMELPLQPENEYITEIQRVFGDDSRIAVAVCKCESQLEPHRIGDKQMKKWSYGLFQVNQTWHDYSAETLLNPKENIRIAHEIFTKYGWSRWACFTGNYYKKYL